MEIKWLNPDAKFDRLVLAGDIGGTNTNLGLVGYKDGKFTLILETVCPSQCIEGLVPPKATLRSSRLTFASAPQALSPTTSAS